MIEYQPSSPKCYKVALPQKEKVLYTYLFTSTVLHFQISANFSILFRQRSATELTMAARKFLCSSTYSKSASAYIRGCSKYLRFGKLLFVTPTPKNHMTGDHIGVEGCWAVTVIRRPILCGKWFLRKSRTCEM